MQQPQAKQLAHFAQLARIPLLLPQAHVSAVAQDQILQFKEQQVSTTAAALKWPLNPHAVCAVLEATPPYCPPRSSKGPMLAARLP